MGRPRERRRPNGSGTERRSKRYRCQHLNPEIRRVKLTDATPVPPTPHATNNPDPLQSPSTDLSRYQLCIIIRR